MDQTKNTALAVCFTQCWACMLDHHYDPPRPHPWADDADLAIAPDPVGTSKQVCGCYCATPETENKDAA